MYSVLILFNCQKNLENSLKFYIRTNMYPPIFQNPTKTKINIHEILNFCDSVKQLFY